MDTKSIIIIVAFSVIVWGAIFTLYDKYMVSEEIEFFTEGFSLEE